MEEMKYTVTITEVLKLYNGKVSRTIYNNWVNRGDYGLNSKMIKEVWYMTEESVIEAYKLYQGRT